MMTRAQIWLIAAAGWACFGLSYALPPIAIVAAAAIVVALLCCAEPLADLIDWMRGRR